MSFQKQDKQRHEVLSKSDKSDKKPYVMRVIYYGVVTTILRLIFDVRLIVPPSSLTKRGDIYEDLAVMKL